MAANVLPLSRLLVLFRDSWDYLRNNINISNYWDLEVILNISTGGKFTGRGASENDKRPVHSEHEIMFDASSTYLQSQIILIRPNTPVMLVAYEIPTGAEFTLETVSIGSRSVQHSNGCCNPCQPGLETQPAVDILFRTPMTLGGSTWKITEDARQMLITVPGTYILALNDDQYLGSIHVESVQLGRINTHIPAFYLPGQPSAATM